MHAKIVGVCLGLSTVHFITERLVTTARHIGYGRL